MALHGAQVQAERSRLREVKGLKQGHTGRMTAWPWVPIPNTGASAPRPGWDPVPLSPRTAIQPALLEDPTLGPPLECRAQPQTDTSRHVSLKPACASVIPTPPALEHGSEGWARPRSGAARGLLRAEEGGCRPDCNLLGPDAGQRCRSLEDNELFLFFYFAKEVPK